jgi:hypothetical protein
LIPLNQPSSFFNAFAIAPLESRSPTISGKANKMKKVGLEVSKMFLKIGFLYFVVLQLAVLLEHYQV